MRKFTGLNLIVLGITFLLYSLDYISGGMWMLTWLVILMVERGMVLHKEKQGLIPLAKTIWLGDEPEELELDEVEE